MVYIRSILLAENLHCNKFHLAENSHRFSHTNGNAHFPGNPHTPSPPQGNMWHGWGFVGAFTLCLAREGGELIHFSPLRYLMEWGISTFKSFPCPRGWGISTFYSVAFREQVGVRTLNPVQKGSGTLA